MSDEIKNWNIEKDLKGGDRTWELHEVFNGTRLQADQRVSELKKSALGDTYHFRYLEAV